MQHVDENVICVSKNGMRIGYKKTRRQKITQLNHIFNIMKPSSQKGVSFSCDKSDTECAICCTGFETTGKYTSKCGHMFHIECIVPWYSKHITCPMCRCDDIEYTLDISIKKNP